MGWKGESRRHSLARRGIRTMPRSSGKRQRFLKNTRGNRVFTGKIAEQIFWDIMNNENPIDYSVPYEERMDEYTFPKYVNYSGFFYEDGVWTAWDNSFGELSVENFKHKEIAKVFASNLRLTHTTLHYVDDNYDYYFKDGVQIKEIKELGGI